MNILSITKNTSSKIKDISLTLILAASLIGLTISASANASATTSIDNALSELVAAQGEKAISELNRQLQQSIESEINALSVSFSIDNAENWWVEDQNVQTRKTSISNEENISKKTHSK